MSETLGTKSNLISIAKGLQKLEKIRFKDAFKNKLKGEGDYIDNGLF